MARLPQPGGDKGAWGSILNDYLSQAHNTDGSLKDGVVTSDVLAPNAVDETVIGATGGSDGQVLTKDISTSTGLSWKTVSGAGTTPDATSTVKGVVQLTGDLGGTSASPTVPGLSAKANDAAVVHLAGAETVTGVKTYSASPVVPTPTTGTQAANKTYVDSISSPDATSSVKGVVQLAGDLGGTAAAPTVTGLSAKANDASVIHLAGAETVTGVKTFSASPVVPTPSTGTQAANKTYVDSVASSGSPDATSSVKGILQLTGDLGGTAASPTVPGLAGKANTSHTHAAADIASGTVATARLGSGTANSSTYLRGDGTWATPSGGGGGYTFTFASVTASTYTATNFSAILADSTSNGITITLPAPVANGLVRVKRLNPAGNGIQVAAPGGSYIDAVSVGTDTLNNQYDSRDYWSDGNNWYR